MYFSGFCIWNGVSQLVHGVKRIFLLLHDRLQCTILQQNGNYSNIPALLSGTLLHPNIIIDDDFVEVFYSPTLDKCIFYTSKLHTT